MNKKNNGLGDDNVAQNRFTAYLMTAIRNRKIQYLRKKQNLLENEMLFDDFVCQDVFVSEPDMLCELPPLDQLEDWRLRQLLLSSNTRDVYILLSKVLCGQTLIEIAHDLGIGLNTVSSIFYRFMAKLRQELGGP